MSRERFVEGDKPPPPATAPTSALEKERVDDEGLDSEGRHACRGRPILVFVFITQTRSRRVARRVPRPTHRRRLPLPLHHSGFKSTQIPPTPSPAESIALVPYQGSEPVPRMSLSHHLRTTREHGTSHNDYRL